MSNYKPRKKTVDGIIIHSMGEYVDGVYAPDFLEQVNLSAHYFVTPEGHIIYGIHPIFIAYHAGVSEFEGQKNLNDTFIGIEFLVKGDHNWTTFKEAIKKEDTFTKEMYEAGGKLCRDLVSLYHISLDRIVRHSTVSGPEVREDYKIDPGKGFKMEILKNKITQV